MFHYILLAWTHWILQEKDTTRPDIIFQASFFRILLEQIERIRRENYKKYIFLEVLVFRNIESVLARFWQSSGKLYLFFWYFFLLENSMCSSPGNLYLFLSYFYVLVKVLCVLARFGKIIFVYFLSAGKIVCVLWGSNTFCCSWKNWCVLTYREIMSEKDHLLNIHMCSFYIKVSWKIWCVLD